MLLVYDCTWYHDNGIWWCMTYDDTESSWWYHIPVLKVHGLSVGPRSGPCWWLNWVWAEMGKTNRIGHQDFLQVLSWWMGHGYLCSTQYTCEFTLGMCITASQLKVFSTPWGLSSRCSVRQKTGSQLEPRIEFPTRIVWLLDMVGI
jgi:hypothetical protein